MIALRKRIETLEISSSRYHEKMIAQCNRELGLPLPPWSDIAEGLIRIKKMIDLLVKLPLGVKDPAAEAIILEFTDWVKSEHARAKNE